MTTLQITASGRAVDPPGMFPTAVRIGGDLLIAFSTVPDGWPGGEVRTARSCDGGATWSDPVSVASPDEGEDAVLGAVGMTILSDGTILLPVNTVTWPPGGLTHQRRIGLRLLRSVDGGHSWIDLRPSVDFAWPAVYGTLLEAEHELLWPIWGRLRDQEKWRSALLASRDGGMTWEVKGTIAYDPTAQLNGEYVEGGNDRLEVDGGEIGSAEFRPHDRTDGFSETSVVRLADGRLFAVIRQQGVGPQPLEFFHAASDDDGATWTPHLPLGISGMSPALHRLDDGTLLLASRRYLPDGSSEEPAVEIRHGSADGLTWSEPLALIQPTDTILTGEYQTGYPAIVTEPGGARVFFYSFAEPGGRFIAWNTLAV